MTTKPRLSVLTLIPITEQEELYGEVIHDVNQVLYENQDFNKDLKNRYQDVSITEALNQFDESLMMDSYKN